MGEDGSATALAYAARPAGRPRAGWSAAWAAGMPRASAPASIGSVAAMLSRARTVARLDLIEPPAMRIACHALSAWFSRDPRGGRGGSAHAREWITRSRATLPDEPCMPGE